MSKLQLKKEIAQLERHQLEQMVLDAYAARKEIKEYFDFFLNPDIEKLTEKYKVAVSSELARHKHGHTKARISAIRKLIKEFEGFQPGFDKEIELLMFVVKYAMIVEMDIHFSDTLINGIAALILKMLDIADRNLVADTVLAQLTELFNNESRGSRYFRRYLRDTISQFRPA